MALKRVPVRAMHFGSPYAEVDGVISAYLLATGSTLFTEWGDMPARFFQIPADPPVECYQVSVTPPCNGKVVVLASAIYGDGDAGIEESWEGVVSELNAMLAAAVTMIEEWRADPKQGPVALLPIRDLTFAHVELTPARVQSDATPDATASSPAVQCA